MKRNSYKLMAAFSSFLLASVCLTASTFAWFSLADDLVLDNVKIGLKSSQKIEIGLSSDDARLHKKYGDELGTWVGDIFYVDPQKSAVTGEMLQDFGQYDPRTSFAPVSSCYSSDYLATATAGYLPVLTQMPTPRDIRGERMAGKSEKSYLQFECYVRTKVEDVYLFLDPTTVVVPDSAANAALSHDRKIPLDDLEKVVDYMRMSFYSFDERNDRPFFTIYEPNAASTDYQKTAFFGRLDIDPADGYYDFDPKTRAETVYGAYTGTPVYGPDGKATAIPAIYDGFHALSYKEADAFDLVASEAAGFVGRYEQSVRPETVADPSYRYSIANSLGFVSLEKPQRFVITCWAEGWDLDCNAYSGEANFEILISLSAEPAKRYLI